MRFRAIWDAPGISSLKTRHRGTAILNTLQTLIPLLKEENVVEVFDSEWTIYPSPATVIADLTSTTAKHISVTELGSTTTTQVAPSTVITSHLGLADPPSTRARSVYNVLDIPATTKGTAQCQLQPPAALRAATTVFASVGKGAKSRYQISSCLLAAGSISLIHMDFHGGGQLIIHYSGVKLWLLWPPTRWNLDHWKAWQQRVTEMTDDDYVWALNTLEGLQIVWFDNTADEKRGSWRPAFVMPPYTLHLVVTFSSSTHGGLRMMRYDWLTGLKRAHRWDCKILSNPI